MWGSTPPGRISLPETSSDVGLLERRGLADGGDRFTVDQEVGAAGHGVGDQSAAAEQEAGWHAEVDYRRGDLVEGAADGQAAPLEDVGVDHGGLEVFVAEQVLDGADVVTALQQVGGKGMTEGVAGDALVDTGLAGGL